MRIILLSALHNSSISLLTLLPIACNLLFEEVLYVLRLKELREVRGVSMKETAKNLGIPYTTYVNYEKGAREPNSETLVAIARFYKKPSS